MTKLHTLIITSPQSGYINDNKVYVLHTQTHVDQLSTINWEFIVKLQYTQTSIRIYISTNSVVRKLIIK